MESHMCPVPAMIFSAYGMNFCKDNPSEQHEPHAFWLIVFIAFMSVSLTLYLIHKKMVQRNPYVLRLFKN